MAKDPVLLNIRKISSIADYVFICSADSQAQVKAIARYVDEGLRKKDNAPIGCEGLDAGKWVLMDCGDIVVHIFFEPVRDFYDIEGLWADAPRLAVKEKKKKAG